ncbi:MAG: cadherin-like domain-containing protein [Actinomycetota bacterium]|nr:cadherin-like domain-containing protein [Actinomycetota bacterium]
MNANGTIRYAPRLNLNGPDSFTYKVSDGQAESAAATVSISITPVNDAPVARNDAARTLINRAVNINVLANDSDVDGDRLSSAIVSRPARGVVSRNANNTIRYTPPRNFVGATSFTYRASDGKGGSSVATVRITVARR